MNATSAVEKQPEALVIGKVGMWWFLASEIMIFGGFIGSYLLFRLYRIGRSDTITHGVLGLVFRR